MVNTPQKRNLGTLDVMNPMESETLLDQAPVKLAPSWESRNIPPEELNFKSLMPNGKPDTPPTDRYNLLFIIFLVHGVGSLMPWNMFITAESYFVDYKLNVTGSPPEYSKNFMQYLGIASQAPNLLCNAINLFVQVGSSNLTQRVVTSLIVEVFIYIITIILAMVDSSSWPVVFFYLTIASVVVLQSANGVYLNSLFGIAAKLPMRYSNAIVTGNNISGILTAVISIISITVSPNLKTAAIYYFLTALFFLLICIDTYFAMPLIRFYCYHKKLSSSQERAALYTRPPFWLILKQTWPQLFNVFFTFFVTLSIFPSVQVKIKRMDPNFFISDTYFIPVLCFFVFNFFAFLGNLIPSIVKWPGPRFLWIPVVLRVLMIPYFILCNYKPDERTFPVYINDWGYAAMCIILAVTSGHLSSLAMMYAPRCVSAQHAASAGMMAAFFLILGIVSGINFSLFLSWLVELPLWKS